MILSFKTQINGKPTFFVEKILKSLKVNKESLDEDFTNGWLSYVKYNESSPKIHTIRKDEKNRWKVGMMIDFFINARQKNMFRFAPRIPVVSIQKIEIIHRPQHTDLYIDEKLTESLWVDSFSFRVYSTETDCPIFYALARNDGFENISDFLEYFSDHFEGKILHWTDLRY